MKNKNGFSLVEILIAIGVIGLLLSLWALSLYSQKKEIRDLKRLSDINAIENALKVVKNDTGTYETALCLPTSVSLCAFDSSSALLKYLPDLGQMNDPSNPSKFCTLATCSDKCNYAFASLRQDDYEILFYLEKGSDKFAQKGCYVATSAGISFVK